MIWRALSVAAVAMLAGCSSTDSGTTGTGTPAPTGPQHLYVSNASPSGGTQVFDLPLTTGSVPSVTLPVNNSVAIAVDSVDLALTLLDGTLQFYHMPITATSTAYAALHTGTFAGVVFDASGDLYQGASGVINHYARPFTSASVPASNIATPGMTSYSMAIGTDGTIYDVNAGARFDLIQGGQDRTSFIASATVLYQGVAATSSQLVLCGSDGALQRIYIFALPIGPSSAPVATITPPTGFVPGGCTFDASGNLYVGGFKKLIMYAPPFTNSSTPSVTITTTTATAGMTVGQ